MDSACALILPPASGSQTDSKKNLEFWEVLFKPMLYWVVDSVNQAEVAPCIAILNEEAKALADCSGISQSILWKKDSAAQLKAAVEATGAEDIFLVYANTPLVRPEDICGSYERHLWDGYGITAWVLDDVTTPGGYGGQSYAGACWIKAPFLLDALSGLGGAVGVEDVIVQAAANARASGALIGSYVAPARCSLAVDNHSQLAVVNEAARGMLLAEHREHGVDIPFADGVVIGPDVTIGPDTRILPGTILRGRTTVGAGCEIGPNSHLENAIIGDGCTILSSYIDSSTLESGVKLGPMSNIRPDCHVGSGAKIGDFVELKNSTIGGATSVAHLTYIGDSDVGEKCNFGCGVVTVNYDGNNKHRTTIGNGVFVGCNTNLVAPVTMGDGSYSAAGTTVTEDVPPDSLVVGRARQSVKENWVREKGLFRK